MILLFLLIALVLAAVVGMVLPQMGATVSEIGKKIPAFMEQAALEAERLADQGRRILSAYLPARIGDKILEICGLLYKNFSSFITGQCLEAVILGIMFVVFMSIFRMPYALVVPDTFLEIKKLDNNPSADYNNKLSVDGLWGVRILDGDVIKHLALYNQLWMELDELYGNYAKCCGLSDCPFWIFYTLYEGKEIYTQKDLSEKLSLSRQTVNSALKSLTSEELVELVPLPGQRKNKQVVLTETGSRFVQKRIVPMLKAEKKAFESLSGEEQEMLLHLTRKYIQSLQKETNRILNVSSED